MNCARCGTEFTSTHHRAKYCGDPCRNAVKAEQLAELHRLDAERRREKKGDLPAVSDSSGGTEGVRPIELAFPHRDLPRVRLHRTPWTAYAEPVSVIKKRHPDADWP